MTIRKSRAGSGPLDRVLSLWATRGVRLVTDDFLYLGLDWIGSTIVHVYKHRRSRRCLNLDEAGHAYVFVPSRDGEQRSGPAYVPCDSPASAIMRLGEGGAAADVLYEEDAHAP